MNSFTGVTWIILEVFISTSVTAGDNVTINNTYDILNNEDLKLLARMPLEKLLKVKHKMNDLIEHPEENPIEINGTEALALSTDPEDPIKRTDVHKNKGGKVNTFFTLSVTTLAFLAFGGYLLCLIVQAIKTKAYPYDQTIAATSQPVMVVTGTHKKKRPQFNYGRKKRDLWMGKDEMYDALIKLSEGYAAWDGIK